MTFAQKMKRYLKKKINKKIKNLRGGGPLQKKKKIIIFFLSKRLTCIVNYTI